MTHELLEPFIISVDPDDSPTGMALHGYFIERWMLEQSIETTEVAILEKEGCEERESSYVATIKKGRLFVALGIVGGLLVGVGVGIAIGGLFL